jgi:PEP-CTERM motif
MPRRAAVFLAILLGLQAASAAAAPVTFTVDSSTSSIGLVFPLSGTLKGDYDAATNALTFVGGGDVAPAINVAVNVTLPDQVIDVIGGVVTLSNLAFSLSLTAPHLDIIEGTVVDGSSVSLLKWTNTGGGSVSGSFDIEFDPIIGFTVSGGGSVTADATFESPFTSTLLTTVGVSEVGSELVLSLLVGVPVFLSNVDVEVPNPVLDFIIDLVEEALPTEFPSVGIPAKIEASGLFEREASVPEPTTALLLSVGLAGAGFVHRRLRRSKASA